MRAGLALVAALAVCLTAGTAWAEGEVVNKPDWMTYKNPYADAAGALASPHRNNDEIAAWAQQAATDTLTFTPDNYRDRLAAFRAYFAPSGWEPYARFIRGTGILEAVSTRKQNLAALAEGTPAVIDSRAVDNVWLWVVHMPLTVTLSGGQGATQATDYTLTLDITRTAGNEGEGMAITGWQIEPKLQ